MNQIEIPENVTNLGTVYPSIFSCEDFEAKRQEIADKVNNGEIGRVTRISTNRRGVEEYYAPALNVIWKQDFS